MAGLERTNTMEHTASEGEAFIERGGGLGGNRLKRMPTFKDEGKNEETNEDISCIGCKIGYSGQEFMIACDSCDRWYHGLCVGVSEKNVPEKWFCKQDGCRQKLLQRRQTMMSTLQEGQAFISGLPDGPRTNRPQPKLEVAEEDKQDLSCTGCKIGFSGQESMISCDQCNVWYHGACVGLPELNLPEKWSCRKCTLKRSSTMAATAAEGAAFVGGEVPRLRRQPTLKKAEEGGGVAEDEDISCVGCALGYKEGDYMLDCDSCHVWYHGHCVGMPENATPAKWYCRKPECRKLVRSSTMLRTTAEGASFVASAGGISEKRTEKAVEPESAPPPAEPKPEEAPPAAAAEKASPRPQRTQKPPPPAPAPEEPKKRNRKRSASPVGGRERPKRAAVAKKRADSDDEDDDDSDDFPTVEDDDESADEGRAGSDDEDISCIGCNIGYTGREFMIACDNCDKWYHGQCVSVREGAAPKTWYCPTCRPKVKSSNRRSSRG